MRALGLQNSLTCEGAAVSRGRKLLNFVDHRADQLLLASGESGRWFVDPGSGMVSTGGGSGGVESDGDELASIAWLPVYGRSPNDLLPWKVQGPNSLQESVVVAAPSSTRPESAQWFCSLRLGVLEGDVKSRSLKRAFGWDRPIPGLVLAVQLVSLSKKFEKLTMVSQKAEMKRKLAAVTPEIYNSLDLLVDSPEFAQVKATLTGRDWLWVGDKFLGSSRVAFRVPVAAGNVLRSVPAELCGYETLLSALGVPREFSPGDFVDVLRGMEAQCRGRPLDSETLATAVGFVKILSQLSPLDRSSIKPDSLLIPDEGGPYLVPAPSLVYDDAPWLSSRLRNMRLVHPDVGDEAAKSLGVRGLREAFVSSQGGIQSMPCPLADEISEALNLSPSSTTTTTDTASASGGKVTSGGGGGGSGSRRLRRSSLGNRWLHDVMEVAETMEAERVEIVLDEQEYEQQSLLHPALADAQGPAVSIVLPGAVMTDKQLLKMLTAPKRPLGGDTHSGDGSGSLGRPRMGNGVAALFALTDCLQVLSHDSLFLFDPCGDYLFSGADPQTSTPTKQAQQRGGAPAGTAPRGSRPSSSAAASPLSSSSSAAGSGGTGSSSASRTPSPSSSFYNPNNASSAAAAAAAAAGIPGASGVGQQTPIRPRSAFSLASSSGPAAARRTVTGVSGGGGRAGVSGGGDGGGGGGSTVRRRPRGPRREPIGRSYVVRREDVLNQFPHQYAPFLALPGGLGDTVRDGLTCGQGFQGTVFRMSLRKRPGAISGSECTVDSVERELKRFSEAVAAGLAMSHHLKSVNASVRRGGGLSGDEAVEQLFSSRLRGPAGRYKRREVVRDAEWRKSGLNVYLRGFTAPRGTYKLVVCTSSWKEGDGLRDGGGGSSSSTSAAGSKSSVVVKGGKRHGDGAGRRHLEDVEDTWVFTYVLAPQDARKLALSVEFEAERLTPLLTCASLVDRSITVNGRRIAQETPAVRGRLFVGQDSSVRTGLPFHVDGPFFVSRRGNGGKAFLVMNSPGDNRASLAQRSPGLPLGKWNKEMFGSVCTELVPEHLVDLKDELSGRNAALLYRFWPSAKRAKMPFSIMLPGQMYLRLGELPLYLSRSASEGGFKRMKDGYFKTQAVSTLVEEVRFVIV
ncbi:unnamed protein product [Scytosiphon promiscuus]